MRLLATFLTAALLLVVCVAVGLYVFGASGGVVESSERTAVGADITDADRGGVEAAMGLDLPPSTVWHAIHTESALDQIVSALVTLPTPDADTLWARPPLDGAAWTVTSDAPSLDAALREWPAWPTLGGSEPGRRTSLDVAPGRVLAVYVNEADPTTRTLRLSWTTY